RQAALAEAVAVNPGTQSRRGAEERGHWIVPGGDAEALEDHLPHLAAHAQRQLGDGRADRVLEELRPGSLEQRVGILEEQVEAVAIEIGDRVPDEARPADTAEIAV